MSSTPNLDARDEHVLSQTTSVRHLKSMALPCLQPSGELLSYLGSPSNHARLRSIESRHARHVPFHRLVQSGERGVVVTTVVSVDLRTHELHVLLRHRLLLKPGGFEGLGVVGNRPQLDQPARRMREACLGWSNATPLVRPRTCTVPRARALGSGQSFSGLRITSVVHLAIPSISPAFHACAARRTRRSPATSPTPAARRLRGLPASSGSPEADDLSVAHQEVNGELLVELNVARASPQSGAPQPDKRVPRPRISLSSTRNTSQVSQASANALETSSRPR